MREPNTPDPESLTQAINASATGKITSGKPATSKKATKTSASANPSGGNYTAQTWAVALLKKLGYPTSAANVQAIMSWEAAEGGHWNNTAYYNPLNTTQTMPGATSMNDVGVKAYTSWTQGLNATVKTLKNGNYGSILSALKSGSNANAVANAVVNSPWGTHTIKIGNYSSYGTGTVDTSNRTVAAGGGGAPGSFGTPQPLSVTQYLDNPDIAANYGYLAAYLKNPEIGPILAKAAQQGWGENQLLGALTKTKWWKTTSETARAWQTQQKLDPATAKQRLGQMYGQIQTLAQSTLGTKLDPKRASQIANTALGQNWSQAQLQNAIGAEFHYNAKQAAYGGMAGQTLGTLKQNAAQYLVPISNTTLASWTKSILEGTYTPDDFTSYLKAQASSLYPTLAKPIASGTTVKQYLDPYAQLAGQTLEINPDQIDWMNPKWSKALNTTTPDGTRAPMSLSDWGSYLRGLPDYQTTAGARSQSYSLANTILNEFGAVSS